MSYLDSQSYLMGNYLMGDEPEIQEAEGGQQSISPPSTITGGKLLIPGGLNLQAYVNLPVIGPIKVSHIVMIIAIAAGIWYIRKKQG
jgi:hypothetical protein